MIAGYEGIGFCRYSQFIVFFFLLVDTLRFDTDSQQNLRLLEKQNLSEKTFLKRF